MQKKIYNWDKLPVFLDLKTTALIFGVSNNTIKNWLYSEKIKGFKIGKKWFFDKTYLQSISE